MSPEDAPPTPSTPIYVYLSLMASWNRTNPPEVKERKRNGKPHPKPNLQRRHLALDGNVCSKPPHHTTHPTLDIRPPLRHLCPTEHLCFAIAFCSRCRATHHTPPGVASRTRLASFLYSEAIYCAFMVCIHSHPDVWPLRAYGPFERRRRYLCAAPICTNVYALLETRLISLALLIVSVDDELPMMARARLCLGWERKFRGFVLLFLTRMLRAGLLPVGGFQPHVPSLRFQRLSNERRDRLAAAARNLFFAAHVLLHALSLERMHSSRLFGASTL